MAVPWLAAPWLGSAAAGGKTRPALGKTAERTAQLPLRGFQVGLCGGGQRVMGTVLLGPLGPWQPGCVCVWGGQEYQIPPPPIIWPCLGSWLPSALPSWSSAHLTCPASPPPSKHLHATVCSHCFSPVKFQVSSPPPPLLLLLCLRALLKRRPPNGCPGMPMARVCRLGVSGQHHDTEKCGLLVMVKTIWLLSGIGECRTSALRV